MRKYLTLLLCFVLAFSLAVPAWADGESYEMVITRTQKQVYRAGQPASHTISGECNAKLYDVIDLPLHDRELFDTVRLSFVDGDNGLAMTRQELVGHNAYTYVSTNPEVVFLLSGTELLPTGNGEAEIIVYDAQGNEVDRFTVSVSGGSGKKLSAPCAKCGVDQGTVLHLMECGHFSCETGAPGHGRGKCAVTGHYNCDGKDHGLCYNCLSWLCSGEHGEGICQHVHSWEYVNSANYWPYVEPGAPMRICTTCGASEYQYGYNPYYYFYDYYGYYPGCYPGYYPGWPPYYVPAKPGGVPVPPAPGESGSGESTGGTSGESGTGGTSSESGTGGTSGESGTGGTSSESGTGGTSSESGTGGTSSEGGTGGASSEGGTGGSVSGGTT